MPWAEFLLSLIGAYAAAGAVFAIGFVARGAQRIDPAARGMPLSARCLLLPGAVLLWPLLAVRWLRQQPPPVA